MHPSAILKEVEGSLGKATIFLKSSEVLEADPSNLVEPDIFKPWLDECLAEAKLSGIQQSGPRSIRLASNI